MTLIDGEACEGEDPPAACGNILIASGTWFQPGNSVRTSTAELYDPATGQWRETAQDPPAGREFPTATSLPDGRVLVAGGYLDGRGPQAEAELFDPTDESWQPAARMPEGRTGHSAVVLPDGRVMAAGGEIQTPTGNREPASSAVTFDPTAGDAGAWSYTDSMTVPREYSPGTAPAFPAFPLERLRDGRVLAAGGADASAEVYTLAAGVVAGTITDAGSGEPIEGATVTVTDSEAAEVAQATTAGDGTYEIVDVAFGDYTVTADAEGYEPATQDVDLGAGETVTADFALQPLLGAVAGKVTDADTGEVIAGAAVSAEGPDTAAVTTTADGSYELAGLTPGDYTVTADAGGYEPASQDVTVEASATATADFSLQPTDQADDEPDDEPGDEPDEPQDACPEGEVPTAAFSDRQDIPDAHRSNVDCAAWREIVAGFADGTYRPTLPVRRDQMATFVAGMLRAGGAELPAPAEERFDDVAAGSAHDEAVHRLAAAQIVLGGPENLDEDSYGPGLRVRRDQMASFLLRAAQFATGEDLASQAQAFADVPQGNVHFATVNGAAEAGFARGFGDGTYRPAATVRRDQMATFVVRVLDHVLKAGG